VTQISKQRDLFMRQQFKPTMDRYICIHGHFYQPPRENPWLEAIELQDAAAPYHDWNERITRECYAPNAVSRILDDQGRIVKLVNNYAKISFNFGPTLLNWLEAKAPDVYAAILEADRQSQENFSGHGSAMAQIYGHVIMPLANSRDRVTQILWGIRDFEHRFKRAPEGMWLPETAVDLETLELLARFDIRFIVLAPHQAARVRRIGETAWREMNGAGIDPTEVYRQQLPSGRSIAIFFYDGPIARAVAFEGLLSRGERFIERLTGAFGAEQNRPQLVHIATDGETYGHHHRFGDMALAYALEQTAAYGLARLTNYGEYLAKNPPTHEVEVVEKSSWSCVHGIERWWSDCGCNSGAHPGWNQQWRTPLRDSLDWLRDQIAPQWETKTRQLLKDPWMARDDYIAVVLDRSEENIRNFFARHANDALDPAQTTTALKLLEMQRNAMLMYTSCGWFFDDLAGIETVEVLQFAGRTVQLAQELFGDSLEERFVRRLAAAKSNLAEEGDGAHIYDRCVRPAKVDWHKLAAHYALSNLFEEFPERTALYCYDARLEDHQVFRAGRAKLGVGRLDLRSRITLESAQLMFAVLHLGDHNMSGSVSEFVDDDGYQEMVRSTVAPFTRADLTAVIREMERRFGSSSYSLRSLFRDEQRKVSNLILAENLQEAESLYRQIYEPREPLLRFLTDLGIPLPKGFSAAADVVLNAQLRAALEQTAIDLKRVISLLEAARLEGVTLETAILEFTYRQTLERLAAALADDSSLASLEQFNDAVTVLPHLPFSVDLWQVQNFYFQLLTQHYLPHDEAQRRGDETARRWLSRFQALGRLLCVKVPD
jgi:alpha-amylase/alpha-mannosidase (GH57 family)